MRLAWHVGLLTRFRNAKKFPELKTFLAEKPEPIAQTAEHHKTMLSMLGLKGIPTNPATGARG